MLFLGVICCILRLRVLYRDESATSVFRCCRFGFCGGFVFALASPRMEKGRSERVSKAPIAAPSSFHDTALMVFVGPVGTNLEALCERATGGSTIILLYCALL